MMWISCSFVRDVRKHKWKAIFRVLYDRTYRRDLQRIRRVIGDGYYKLVESELPLCQIHNSHAINYHDWVNTLVGRMFDTHWHPQPIKVIRDPSRNWAGGPYYLVVDGNHRLVAMKRIYSPGKIIKVYELVREA
jgi:hypothetical protein